MNERVTFENFAMFLNLINNVYIKGVQNNGSLDVKEQVIDEEEEESDQA